EPDRLPHDNRVRSADQGRNRCSARRAAWRGRDRRGPPAARLELPALCDPEDVRAEWRAAGGRGEPGRRAWDARLQSLPEARRSEFLRRQRKELPPGLDEAVAKICSEFREKNAKIATRQASGTVLDTLTRVVPELVGGSADLTPSNNT